MTTCSLCAGRGSTIVELWHGYLKSLPCPRCHGTGEEPTDENDG